MRERERWIGEKEIERKIERRRERERKLYEEGREGERELHRGGGPSQKFRTAQKKKI